MTGGHPAIQFVKQPGLINITQQGIGLDNNIIVLNLLCCFPAVISNVQISGRATEGSLQTWKAN